MSAVISSLVQLCALGDRRTQQGISDILNKDWTALGHPFATRLFGETFSPTLLLFLDCVSQLVRLYPAHFHFSEYLLVALWDLAITGLVPSLACNNLRQQVSSGVIDAFLQMDLCKQGGPFPLKDFLTPDYCKLFYSIPYQASRLLQGWDAVDKEIVWPPTCPSNVQLWLLCYLRWVPPANLAVISVV